MAVKVGQALFLVAGGFALGAVTVAACTRRKQPEALVEAVDDRPEIPELPAEIFVEPLASENRGLAMVGGLVIVTDETTFYRYLGVAIDPLFKHGQPTADAVLLRVLSDRFPDVAWPPEEGTPAAAQWDFMRERVSAILERYNPTPTPRLRVVK